MFLHIPREISGELALGGGCISELCLQGLECGLGLREGFLALLGLC